MQAACTGVGRLIDIALRAWTSQSSNPKSSNVSFDGLCCSSTFSGLSAIVVVMVKSFCERPLWNLL